MSIYKDGLAVVLLSGGVDSAVALYASVDDGFRVLPLFVNYGQKNINKELEACSALVEDLDRGRCAALKVVSICFGSMLDAAAGDKRTDAGAYIPARNLILASIGVSYAEKVGAKEVVLGLHAGSRYPDCQFEFLSSMDRTAKQATYLGLKLDVTAPLMHLTKQELVERGQDIGVPFELTWSCESPRGVDGMACGVCNGCMDRERVLGKMIKA